MSSAMSLLDLVTSLGAKLESAVEYHGSARLELHHLPFDVLQQLSDMLPRLQLSVMRAQNVHSSINRLPIEILAHIFELAKTSDWRVYGDQQSGRIVRMSLVCRHWRHVALGFPSLWSTIQLRHESTYNFEFAALCLERSRYSPLTIVISTLFRGPQIGEFLAPYASRIRGVMLLVPFRYASTNVGSYILSTCRFSAPNLQSLRISAPTWAANAPPVLPTLFNDNIPNLKQLHIESFSSWPGHCFTRLAHLAISCQSQYEHRSSMTNMLDVLEANPLLEEILVDDACPSLESLAGRPRVRLPRLRLICFIVSLSDSELPSQLLSHLDLPREATIRIHLDMMHTAEQSALSPFPTDLRPLAAFTSVDHLILRDDVVVFNEPSLLCAAVGADSGVAVSHRLRNADPYGKWCHKAVQSFFEPVSCASIRSLWLAMNRTADGFGVDEWRSVFDALPDLEELTIIDHHLPPIIAALRPVNDVGPFPVPKLAKLRLIRPRALDVNILTRTAEERRRLARPITSIHLLPNITLKAA
ncbi:uncharacterized protein STEHIDRAFT_170794, partial [Stereum hirsutum FP-91666 SS1]|uniref:uncharacterized protein n=1 Tax=Stereum hirsutum (strain FP-91666) TaxID=721885 RepID=UPI0004449D4B